MSRLHFSENVHQWIVAGLHQSRADERKEHDEAMARLQAEYERLTQRLGISSTADRQRNVRHDVGGVA